MSAFAKDTCCTRKAGSTQCTAGTIPNLNAHGMVWLHGTHIQKKCTVHGLLHTQDAHIHNLVLMGQGDINASHIHNNALAHGDLHLKNSHIKGTLCLHANRFSAYNSQIAQLEVHSSDNAPSIVLTGNTQVLKDIVFIGSPGTVSIHPHAKILGKIVNGSSSKA